MKKKGCYKKGKQKFQYFVKHENKIDKTFLDNYFFFFSTPRNVYNKENQEGRVLKNHIVAFFYRFIS